MMFNWINDNNIGIEFERLLYNKGSITFGDLKKILKLEEKEQEVKTKYKLGFSFYYNHQLCKIIGIYINSRAQILYKVATFLKEASLIYIILNQAQLDLIIAGKANA